MGAVEDKEHEGGAAGWKLTGTMHMWRAAAGGEGMYGPASGIWSELTLHRGAAAAGEAETINNRATHLLCVCRFCTYSTITGTIWGRRVVG